MRVLTVLFAYACAAIAAAVLVFSLGSLVDGESPVESISDLRWLGTFAVIAAIYAAPVALPTIIATELRKRGNWNVFTGAGALLGLLVAILFAEIPYRWASLPTSAIFFSTAVISAAIYWLIAWKWLPPASREPIDLGRAYL